MSAYYWPEPSGNAPYIAATAEHLVARGHTVDVIAGQPHYPTWKRESRKSELRNGVSIRRHWHHVPSQQSTLQRALYEATVLLGSTTALRLRRPDVVVGVSPLLAGALAALQAGRLYGRPSALILQDLMGVGSRESGFSGGSRVAHVVERTEYWAARNAAAVGIVSEGFRPHLEENGVDPMKIVRLRNWALAPQVEAEGGIRRELGWGEREFVCLHAGNMGHKQGLENVIAAAELARDEGIRFVMLGDGNQRANLEAHSRQRRVSNLQFVGSQPAGRYEQILAAADVLVINQRPSVSAMSFPSKMTSYLAAGRPIVAAVGRGSEAGRELALTKAAVVVPPGQPNALVDAVLGLKRDPEMREALGRAGVDFVQRELQPSTALAAIEAFITGVARQRTVGGVSIEAPE